LKYFDVVEKPVRRHLETLESEKRTEDLGGTRASLEETLGLRKESLE